MDKEDLPNGPFKGQEMHRHLVFPSGSQYKCWPTTVMLKQVSPLTLMTGRACVSETSATLPMCVVTLPTGGDPRAESALATNHCENLTLISVCKNQIS
jgi:hypothetical protein